ncbi:tripartite tricarboxylate transporter TctB family protein [Marivita sp. S6314]|uniref:tripartite tricarboxylate transporter TctB family protein n=1 Tax=Marivita sp. S6314 TaxID=2926406 RepID=UPI001FF58B8F|nr:tripartite tricarboxylate transporter TctB family protein [Marivita sp. S6314]MCK0148480.1 tripartite tricarboxylate transporter TctB family protein [Marivita sp. S6314]
MALDRWIALVLLGICGIYGYAAWFTMDAGLPPFMQRNPIWPSTFPKVLSILAMGAALVIVLGLEKGEEKIGEIDYRKIWEYNLGQALLLLALMVAYALLLRPIGFIGATAGFLILGSVILGERRWLLMIVVAAIATGGVWYLVSEVLGIFMAPLPAMMRG